MVRYSCRMTYFHNTTGNKSQLGLNLTWISLDVIENKTRNKENKTFLNYYPGAFEQAVCLGHGAFASEFSKNPNSWGSVWGGGGGGRWVLLELTDALLRKYQKIYTYSCDLSVMSRKPEAWKFYNIDWDSCIGRHKRPPCYISWCNCINHIFSLFLSGYKECSDTGIKQASKWEREIIN